MTAATEDATYLSDLTDAGDLPLGEASLSDAEYETLLRRTGIAEGEAGTPVSAFNSSI